MTIIAHIIETIVIMAAGEMPGKVDRPTLFVWADRHDYKAQGEISADVRYLLITPDGRQPQAGNKWCSFGSIKPEQYAARLEGAAAAIARDCDIKTRYAATH